METLTPELAERLIAALQMNAEAVNKLVNAMDFKAKRWLNPDEACTVLGFQIAKSGTHRRRLQFLREKGLLTKFRPGKPVMYDAEEMEQMAEKIRKGKVFVPANF